MLLRATAKQSQSIAIASFHSVQLAMTNVQLILPKYLELPSPTDSLQKIREKMQEYIENGTRLGWLINVEAKQVEIYRPLKDVEILENPKTITDEDVLPGFVFDLKPILYSY